MKTASRIGNIIRKILFQKTNGEKIVRDAKAMAANIAAGLFSPAPRVVFA